MTATLVLAALQTAALVWLTVITRGYARSTARMVEEVARQAAVMGKQSRILAISARIAAWSTHGSDRVSQMGQEHIERLRKLVENLEPPDEVE